jgi:LemA protein
MNAAAMLVVLLAAVLVFWLVGAYNRLVALRNDTAAAWAKVHDTVRARAAAIEPMLMALQQPMAAEQGALQAVSAAHDRSQEAANRLAKQAVSENHARAWATAELALSAATSRVLALLDQHPELRTQEPVAAWALAWYEARKRLPFVRQAFNETATAYNNALAVFPTSLAARMFGFGPSGQI